MGGMSSKFWQVRKYLNEIEPLEYQINPQSIPFYAWNCITIQTQEKDLDLVIPKMAEMKKLVRFLSYATNSLDGHTDSSLTLQNKILSMKKKSMTKEKEGNLH